MEAVFFLILALAVRWLTPRLRRLADAAEASAGGDPGVGPPKSSTSEEMRLVGAIRRLCAEMRRWETARAVSSGDLGHRLGDPVLTELERERSLHRQILESLAEGVVVVDRDGRFLLWNRKAVDLTGRGPEDVTPGRWPEHYGVWLDEEGGPIPPEELPLSRAMRGESCDGVEVFLKGAGRWLSVSGRPLRDPAGNLAGGLVTLIDATERRQEGERREARERELMEYGRISLVAEMGAIVGHELSQPLSAVANYSAAALQLQRSGGLSEERLSDILSRITRLTGRAGRILEGLRALTTRRPAAPVDTQLNGLVTSCLDLLAGRCRRRGVRVATDLGPDLPTVRGDPTELEQLLMHLVINALESLERVPPGQRRLTVATRPLGRGEGVLLEVRDTGAGLPVEGGRDIFEPWVTHKPDGLGLGLSIVRGITQAYGGRVWCEPDADVGATFRVELPRRGKGR